jgi:hypothetical protein
MGGVAEHLPRAPTTKVTLSGGTREVGLGDEAPDFVLARMMEHVVGSAVDVTKSPFRR